MLTAVRTSNPIKVCLNETYSKVNIGKHLSDAFPRQNGLKQGDALLLLLFNFSLGCACLIKQRGWNCMGHMSV
jgi:hypothetical protein